MTQREIQAQVLQLAKDKIETKVLITGEIELENLLNSITYIQFLIACEDEFDIEIDDDELDMSNFHTLNDIARYIEKRVNQNE